MVREKLHAYARHVEENGGDDWVFSFVEEGHPMKTVAELTGCSSRGLLYSWIKHGGDERKNRLRAARKVSAHSLAEDAGEVLEELAKKTLLTSADVSLGSSRARYKQWLAGMRNRDEYGDKSGVEVNISVGELHLDALRRNSAELTSLVPGTEVEEAEYEVIDTPSDEETEVAGTLPDELSELL